MGGVEAQMLYKLESDQYLITFIQLYCFPSLIDIVSVIEY